MKPNFLAKQGSSIGRWLAKALLFTLAIAFTWQGTFFLNSAALADSNLPGANLIASANAGDRAQQKADRDAGRTKNFIRDTADRVERTAKNNAERVGEATDNNGSFVERKARRDAARIEQRAEHDAARTQKAVDDTKNVVERAVDGIKDAFSN